MPVTHEQARRFERYKCSVAVAAQQVRTTGLRLPGLGEAGQPPSPRSRKAPVLRRSRGELWQVVRPLGTEHLGKSSDGKTAVLEVPMKIME